MIPEEVEMLLCAQLLHVVQCLDYNITPQITEKKTCVFLKQFLKEFYVVAVVEFCNPNIRETEASLGHITSELEY